MRAALALLFLVVTALGVGAGCCELSPGGCEIDVGEGEGEGEAVDCESGACAISTVGCDPTSIEDRVDGSTCAACDGAEICGQPDVARCETREDSQGELCRNRTTVGGEILFDSCFDEQVPVASCEPAPVDPNSPLFDQDVVCETCSDVSGNVVSTTCEPAHDECHEVTEQSGRVCRECTRGENAEVVVYACEQPDIEPRSCEVYENDAGRCIDCFGEDDSLLSHSCTLAGDPFVSCTESLTADGLRCTECIDANGGQVERSCVVAVPELSQCSLLDYTDQSCVVCVDAAGAPAFWECEALCADPVGCPDPAECVFENSADGQLCRSCPALDGSVEQACVADTNLTCTYVDATDPTFPGAACLSCTDAASNVEVYRRCNGTDVPPTCHGAVGPDGIESCEVCDDPNTGQPIYATCDGQTCYELGAFQLFSREGTNLFVDNAPAVASCASCDAAATVNLGVASACTLRDSCGPIDLTAPSTTCDGSVVFTAAPRLCQNPWDDSGFGGVAGPDEILSILSFALEQGGVALIGVEQHGSGNNGECVDDCACVRTDRLLISARPQDAPIVSELFDAVLERCVEDSECSGGTCRTDGACAP